MCIIYPVFYGIFIPIFNIILLIYGYDWRDGYF